MDTFLQRTRAARSLVMDDRARCARRSRGCGGSGGSTAAGEPAGASTPTPAPCSSASRTPTATSSAIPSTCCPSRLQRRGGGTVEVLPATTRIDFAQLTDLSDLLAVATLAPGDIVGGKIRLDYAQCRGVRRSPAAKSSAPTSSATNGAPLGVTELDIELAARQPPGHHARPRGVAGARLRSRGLARRRPRRNRRRSSRRAPTSSPRSSPSPRRSSGCAARSCSTDVAGNSYTVDVRPWFRPDGNHGRVTVHTTASTSFEIDGVARDRQRGPHGAGREARRHDDGRVRHALDAGASLHGRDRARRRQRQRRAHRRRARQHRRAQRRPAHGQGRLRGAPRSRRALAPHGARQRRRRTRRC